MMRLKLRTFSVLLVLGLLSIGVLIPLPALADSVSGPQPIQIIPTSQGPVKVFDTKSLLQRKDVQVRSVVAKHIKIEHPVRSGATPNTQLGGGVDVAYYDLVINWIYLHSDYQCGYIATDLYSVTGPAQGSLQAELYIDVGAQEYNPWNYNQDFTTSLYEESGCYDYSFGVAVWTCYGGGAMRYPDGTFLGTGSTEVQGLEGYS